jgi:hypothetical protein
MNWNALRAGLILTVSVSFGLAAVEALGQSGGKCPLTEDQSKKSVAAFSKIADFATSEPRCVNCHGGVNPYIKGTGLDPDDPNAPFSIVEHGGPVIEKKADYGKLIDGECLDCHNDMALKRNGSPSTWMTASFAHFFANKDAVTLCRQFKLATESAEKFLGHATDDNGDNNNVQTAFNGNRGLSGVTPEPPSLTHDAFIQLAKDWIDAMGGKFQGDELCGCELTHDKWSGTIRYVLQTNGDEGHEQTLASTRDWSSSSTTTIMISLTNGVGTARFSVQGIDQSVGVGSNPGGTSITSKTETSGQGTFPASADVVLFQDTYQVYWQLQLAGQSVKSLGGTPIIGKKHTETCLSQFGCTGGDTDLIAPMLPPGAPLSGKVSDPNHVFGTITKRTDGLGTSHKGVSVETTTVDLWRTPSAN